MPAAKPFMLDLTPLRWLVRQFRGNLPEPLPRQWVARYSAYARRRYTREGAMGPPGYNRRWKALEPATKARRREAGKGARILWDTGTVLTALEPGRPGNLVKKHRGGVWFGFGGSARHGLVAYARVRGIKSAPKKAAARAKKARRLKAARRRRASTATIAEIAKAHDAGAGNLPQRMIIVPPDNKTLIGMGNDLKRVVRRLGLRAERRLKSVWGTMGRVFRPLGRR